MAHEAKSEAPNFVLLTAAGDREISEARGSVYERIRSQSTADLPASAYAAAYMGGAQKALASGTPVVLVISADLLGRFVMVALIVRANLLNSDKAVIGAVERCRRAAGKAAFQSISEHSLLAYQPKVFVLGRARGP